MPKKNSGQFLYKKAKKLILGGNMLLSKRPEMFLPEKWPAYFKTSNGINVTDLNNKKYIDMICAVGTNILGYSNSKIDNAVKKTISKGIMSSLNCPEEVYLSDKLIKIHKWANKVKYCRSGGEANAMAIRIARCAAKNSNVAICGYHGWHDWYLAGNLKKNQLKDHLLPNLKTLGVPKQLKNTVFSFEFNNRKQLISLVNKKKIGIIKMEVARNNLPNIKFLKFVRNLANKKKIILIFDECTTGFRRNLGGMHLKTGINPDILMLGKAIGNGYAITAVLGKNKVMKKAEESFISSTFWTERIGYVAALNTIKMFEKMQPWKTLIKNGKYLNSELLRIAKKNNIKIKISGYETITSFNFLSPFSRYFKTYLTQQMLKKGFLASTLFYLTIYHDKKIIFDNKQSLTYFELMNLAYINSKKIKDIKSDFIPIIVDRNIQSVIAIISVILSKKIFCPISNVFPEERIIFFLKILKSNFLINCSKKKIDFKEQYKIRLISKKKDFTISYFKNLNETFYLLFTSGTTGKPKGVKLSFKNIYNTIVWSKSYLNWKNHKMGIATQFSFDISMFDLFSGLYFGVPMYILQNPSNPHYSLKEIKKNKVTSIFSVPTFFSNFVKYNLIKKKILPLKRIISGGDFFSNNDIWAWKKNQKKTEIYNVWGPTETSIVNTMYKITTNDENRILEGKSIPVGKSHPLMQLKILKNKKNLKKNKIGEICMIGDCVSQGYIGNLKNSKNYLKYNSKKAYLTGDLGYLDNKDYLHIVGRKDNTIKISGYRVDSLEVEKLISTNFNVSNVRLLKLTISEINFLCLAIETKKKIKLESIINLLKRRLPSYSIPKKIFFFNKFPLNQNSKIDKKKIENEILKKKL